MKYFPSLETDRLFLKPLSLDDVDLIFSLRSDPESMKFIERPLMASKEEAISLVERVLELMKQKEAFHWTIFLKSNNVRLGNITFWNLSEENKRGELGFMLLRNFQSNGYMNESVQAVSNWIFEYLKFNSIEAHTRPENVACKIVLEKNGFNQEANLSQNVYFDDRFWNTLIFTKLKKEEV